MIKNLKKNFHFFVILLLVAGCAGRPANPVMVDQLGDNKKSCPSIEKEMRFIEEEINKLVPQTDKTNKNELLGVTGAIFVVPLFFMDLSESEKIEVNAYRQRYNRLNILATDKECPFTKVETENK